MNPKDRIQRKWDKWLIKGWYEFRTYGWVWYKFSQELYPEKFNESGWFDFYENQKYLIKLNLKRCLIFTEKGEPFTPRVKTEIRGYILERSKTLSACLVTDRFNRIEILLDIDSFKWRDSEKRTKSAQNEINKRRRHQHTTGYKIKVIKRDLSKKHDWRTVK